MEATLEAPVETGGGESMESLISNTADLITGTPSETEQPTESNEYPGGEGPADTQPTPVSDPQPGGEAPTSDYQLSEDGQNYLVPKAELPNLKTLREYNESVQARFPTAQDAEVAHRDATGWRAMNTDFLHGGAGGLDGVLGFLAGRDASTPEAKAQFQQAFTAMAKQLPEAMAKYVGPEAEHAFASSMVQREIDMAYKIAAQSGDPADLKSAQWLDYGWTGQYKTALPKGPAAPDPLSAREQALNQRETAIVESQWKSLNDSTIEGPKWQQFNAELDRTLNPVKANYDPAVWKHLREGIAKDLLAKMGEDQNWASTHGNTLRSLQSTFSTRVKAGQGNSINDIKNSAKTYQNDFMMRMRRHLPSIAAPLLRKGQAPAQSAAKTAAPNARAPQATNGQPRNTNNGQFKSLADRDKAYDALLSDTVKLL